MSDEELAARGKRGNTILPNPFGTGLDPSEYVSIVAARMSPPVAREQGMNRTDLDGSLQLTGRSPGPMSSRGDA